MIFTQARYPNSEIFTIYEKLFYYYVLSEDIWSGEGPKPDWLETEREHFSKYRDRDEDGYLSKDEVSFMVAPPKYDPANAEAKHLIQEADTDEVIIPRLKLLRLVRFTMSM